MNFSSKEFVLLENMLEHYKYWVVRGIPEAAR